MPCALPIRSEEHTSELQSPCNIVCRLLLEKKTVRDHAAYRRERSAGRPHRDGVARHGTELPRAAPEVPELSSAHAVMLSPISFFFNDTATTEIYTLSLHDALPI